MVGTNNDIVTKINKYSKVKKYVITFCIILLIAGVLIFSFYIFGNNSQVIKFVSEYKNKKLAKKIEKVMTNPRIKFEYKDNQFYDITAARGVHENEQEILLFDVFIKGESINIKAGKLFISNNGDNLHFSDNPVVVITTAHTK